jgi:hypothetical protein
LGIILKSTICHHLYLVKKEKDFTLWTLPEASISCVTKGLQQAHNGCVLEALPTDTSEA